MWKAKLLNMIMTKSMSLLLLQIMTRPLLFHLYLLLHIMVNVFFLNMFLFILVCLFLLILVVYSLTSSANLDVDNLSRKHWRHYRRFQEEHVYIDDYERPSENEGSDED